MKQAIVIRTSEKSEEATGFQGVVILVDAWHYKLSASNL
jgi:hypothetical protein